MSDGVNTEPTTTQTPGSLPALSPLRVVTDLLFGVAVPLGCLVFDPVVFRGSQAAFDQYALVGYSAAGLGMIALPLWLLFGRPAGLFAGLLAGGTVFAVCLGLVLLPFSLIGLVVLIGVLGFTPFLTAWVFARNARRAWVASGGRVRPAATLLACVGFGLACTGPWASYWYVRYSASSVVDALASGDPVEAERAANRLKRFEFLVPDQSFDHLVWAYRREPDGGRRRALAEVYHQLTGQDIEIRLSTLCD